MLLQLVASAPLASPRRGSLFATLSAMLTRLELLDGLARCLSFISADLMSSGSIISHSSRPTIWRESYLTENLHIFINLNV